MNEEEKQAYQEGYEIGYSAADYCESIDEFSDWQDNFRQYSPFEFRAHRYNEAENSEELWDAYDSGEFDGFRIRLKERGIE